MSTAIFDDLEIDKSTMLSNPEGFLKAIHEKADELKEVCRKSVTIQSLSSRYDDNRKEVPLVQQELLDTFYVELDNMTLDYMADAIQKVKRLATDLETAYKDRLIREASQASGTTQDKKLAHIQYSRLREAHEAFIKALPILGRSELVEAKLPPLPGNYGGGNSTFVHYVFNIGDDEYRNHYAVCRKLGIETRPLMDVIDYIEANPGLGVSVKEVS